MLRSAISDFTARGPKPTGRPGFSLIELLVAAMLIAFLSAVGMNGLAGARDRSNNAKVDSNLHQLAQGLLTYEADNEKFPPALTGATDALCETNRGVRQYVPGNHLPSVPWTNIYQSNTILVGNGTGNVSENAAQCLWSAQTLNGAGDFTVKVKPMALPKVKPLDPSGPSRAGAFAPGNFGAIIYSTNGTRNLYAIYGVGKLKGDAVVVALQTNAR